MVCFELRGTRMLQLRALQTMNHQAGGGIVAIFWPKVVELVAGLEHVSSRRVALIIPTDGLMIFQRAGEKPPTSCRWVWMVSSEHYWWHNIVCNFPASHSGFPILSSWPQKSTVESVAEKSAGLSDFTWFWKIDLGFENTIPEIPLNCFINWCSPMENRRATGFVWRVDLSPRLPGHCEKPADSQLWETSGGTAYDRRCQWINHPSGSGDDWSWWDFCFLLKTIDFSWSTITTPLEMPWNAGSNFTLKSQVLLVNTFSMALVDTRVLLPGVRIVIASWSRIWFSWRRHWVHFFLKKRFPMNLSVYYIHIYIYIHTIAG